MDDKTRRLLVLITVENLTKEYASTLAVNDISFQVKKNEVLGFLGPNGAGKSTTLRILTGYLSATSGRAFVDGHDVFENPEAVKKVIGYLPENVPLYPEMRAEEFLFYRAALKKIPRNKRKAAVDGAIERCQVGDVRNKIIGQLSKGYRQRVGLADALVGDPKILILDEPTIGLDPNQIRQVRSLVRALGEERTVILSSHILPEVEAVCTRVQIINKGKIVGQGRPDDLRAQLLGNGVTIEVQVLDPDGAAQLILEGITKIRNMELVKSTDEGLLTFSIQADEDLAVREQIFDAAVDGDFKVVGLSCKNVSLEDIFVQITTSEETNADEEGKTSDKVAPDQGGAA
jgi:gliding motility-associated transport system ATP-binding protein